MAAPTQFELDLHQRLLDRDPVAPEEAVRFYLPQLVRLLRMRPPRVQDATLLEEAASETLFAFVERPSAYNPAKASLLGYLALAARRDLFNLLERERRQTGRMIWLEDVAQRGDIRNTLIAVEDGDPAAIVGANLATEEWVRWVREALPDPVDRTLFRLMAEGERETAVYSVVLGIEELPPTEQRKIVKRHKDRITKRLQRQGERRRE